MEPYDPQAALHDVERAETRLADRLGHCPPWRHAVFGALFFALIGSIAISSQAQFITTPLVMLGVVLILQYDRRRLGVFINGYRRGRTLPVTLGFVAMMVAMVVAAMHLRNNGFSDPSKLGLAMIAFVLAVGFSIVWTRTFQRELEQHR